ncbi:MAG: hypothetical protein J5I93_14050 [Pirellulaceae bacterium]|nr:hypothetical protein [Pirellulaceae bacterium]
MPDVDPAVNRDLAQVVGYVNFSSGAADGPMLASLNRVFAVAAASVGQTGSTGTSGGGEVSSDEEARSPWRIVAGLLQRRLEQLPGENAAFRDVGQAAAVLDLAFRHVLPAYRQFHRDLLAHQSDELLFNSFFVGRVFEAVLRQGGSWEESERITAGAIRQLNDYVGHRPVATLETHKGEPYAHEWVRPVPLYVRDAGVAVGPYEQLVATALTVLRATDEDLLRAAYFDLDMLDEVALDPRAYDFDHPVHKRQNYHFGQWDPHHLDGQARYGRFVLQQVTLDALLCRIEQATDAPPAELLFEAGAVLAGTILMSSGISGSGPDTHDSTVTLARLLPRIAGCRDEFYKRLLDRIEGAHATRLRAECQQRQQAFGGARQHLNSKLARRRAQQLQHVHLARMYARLGRCEAAAREAAVVPSASACMTSQMECWLTEGRDHVAAGRLERAAEVLPRLMNTLRRAIECGAVVDPWNILGYDGHFSLFAAAENSVVDHRVEELVELMEQVFALYAEIWREAAAHDQQALCERIRHEFQDTVGWWRQFAVHEVSSVDCEDAQQSFHAAEKVAEGLDLWQKAGAAAGDVRFWAPHAEMFDSPRAYALVVESLLEHGDFVSARALLMHWLGQVDRVPLEQGPTSFCRLAQHWLLAVRRKCAGPEQAELQRPAWRMVCRFFNFLEANAETYWIPPSFALGQDGSHSSTLGESAVRTDRDDEADESAEGLFDAAYQDVVFRDSTDDGIDGAVFEQDLSSDDALARESQRLGARLSFLSTLARLWRLVAVCRELIGSLQDGQPPDADELVTRAGDLRRWLAQAELNREGLMRLLRAVHEYRLPIVAADHDSMVEYDRRRTIKDSLLERAMSCLVLTADACRWLRAAAEAAELARADAQAAAGPQQPDDERLLVATFRDLLRGDEAGVRRTWPLLRDSLAARPLLYVPLSKGGEPAVVVDARVRQQGIQDLLAWLPQLGLLRECCQLIETARHMERNNPVGPGAVTDFDALFKTGYRAVIQAIVTSSQTWPAAQFDPETRCRVLIDCLEQVSESLLSIWLAHSRTLRISVLEKLNDRRVWRNLVPFIQKYGEELFTQTFLNLGNLRAILHQGTDAWLRRLERTCPDEEAPRLIRELDTELPRREAVEMLTLILESVAENYAEYRDYNSTTTQSDHGSMLYTLLDFLRLRTRYDRVCWNLKPYVLAHGILVRHGNEEAARIWREAVTERVDEEAEAYLTRLAELQRTHAMQMPTIADRLAERFVRPMYVDRMRWLVEPALWSDQRDQAFAVLQQAVDRLAQSPTGVGLDVPAWLVALEDEVEQARRPQLDRDLDLLNRPTVPLVSLTWEEIQRQLADWSQE